MAIAVSDTGIGMSPGMLATIFTPFEQGGRERSRRSGGLGLGMSIAHELVGLMEGTLVAESPGFGCGSTVTVTLPGAESHAKTVSPPSRLPDVTRKGRILLVEDHADSAAALARVLRARGYEVMTSESVAGALNLFQQNNFNEVFDLKPPSAPTRVRSRDFTPRPRRTRRGRQRLGWLAAHILCKPW